MIIAAQLDGVMRAVVDQVVFNGIANTINTNGRPVGSVKEVDAIMTRYGVGDRIIVTVMSNNRNISSEIELAKAKY